MRFVDVHPTKGQLFQRHVLEPAICFDEYNLRYARLNRAAIVALGLKHPESYYTTLRVSPEDQILAIKFVKADGPPTALHKKLSWTSHRFQAKICTTGLIGILGKMPEPGYYPLRTEPDIDYYYVPIGPEDRIAEKWPYHNRPRKKKVASMTVEQLERLLSTLKEDSKT